MTELEFKEHLEQLVETARKNGWLHCITQSAREFDILSTRQITSARKVIKEVKKYNYIDAVEGIKLIDKILAP